MFFFWFSGFFELQRHMYEKTNSFYLCLCKDLRGFGARTHKNTAEGETETAIGGCQLASLKGSHVNIRRCLKHVTWRGDWEQIRRGTDGNEAEVGSQNREKKERTCVNKWKNFNVILGGSNTLHRL